MPLFRLQRLCVFASLGFPGWIEPDSAAGFISLPIEGKSMASREFGKGKITVFRVAGQAGQGRTAVFGRPVCP
jgi:hypothetical protein